MTGLRLLADENVDQEVVTLLRNKGYDVIYVVELEPGISDDEVLAQANERNALLLTADNDFGELVYRQRRISQGVILLRLAGFPAAQKAAFVSAAIETHAEELSEAFTVISPGMVRIRPRL
jgi:predicted nuclease of predicted toxin-antitoxin system